MTMYLTLRIYLVTHCFILYLRLKLHHKKQQQKQHTQRWQRLELDQNNLNAKLTGLRLSDYIETNTQLGIAYNQSILCTQQLILSLLVFLKLLQVEKKLTSIKLRQYTEQLKEITKPS